jgi:ABC-type nitrate/sulfonate/bicarbonate transport system substrate-binding protein
MEGHTYATWELPIEQATIKQCMEDEGADFSKLKMLPETIDDEVAALKSKQVDCIWVYYAWAGINAEVQKFPVDYFAFRDINEAFDYYSPVIIANDDFLKDDPETAKACLAAISKGYQYAIENPDDAADLLLKANPELDENLVKASQKWLADKYQEDASQWGVFDADRWNRFFKWLNENKLTEKEIPENVGFTNDYLPAE